MWFNLVEKRVERLKREELNDGISGQASLEAHLKQARARLRAFAR
jgi:hypothetical protein